MIRTRTLEFNVVEHCNLRCVECSHLSPFMPRKFMELEPFLRDMSALKPVLKCDKFKFVGGEPLLHRQLMDFIRAVADLGMAEYISVATNGTEIMKQPDDFFRSIGRLEFSWYPDTPTTAEMVEYARRKCAEAGVQFKLYDRPAFRSMQLDAPNDDDFLMRRIYRTCEIAHKNQNHVIREGRYYKCSRPLFTGTYLARKGVVAPDFAVVDGVDLHAPRLEERLQAYIADPEPLQSCRFCLGTVGKPVAHRQMAVAEVKSAAADPRRAADHVNVELLQHLESDRRAAGSTAGVIKDLAVADAARRLVATKRPPLLPPAPPKR